MKTSRMRQMWKETREELRNSRKYIFIICGVFIVSAIFGYIFSNHLTFLDKLLRDLITQVKDVTGARLTLYILLNNAKSALFSMFLGVFLGIVPILNSLVNGTVIGYVFAKVVQAEGAVQLWRILPHGIFELPAIFIALGEGLRLGVGLFTKIGRRDLPKRLYRAFLIFIFIVLPLLMLAAIIESLLITFF